MLPKLCVLFTLTNARGEYDLALAIENEATGESIVEIRGPLDADDPLGIADFHVELIDVGFPAAGKYWITVNIEGEIINQRPIMAMESKAEERRDAGSPEE